MQKVKFNNKWYSIIVEDCLVDENFVHTGMKFWNLDDLEEHHKYMLLTECALER